MICCFVLDDRFANTVSIVGAAINALMASTTIVGYHIDHHLTFYSLHLSFFFKASDTVTLQSGFLHVRFHFRLIFIHVSILAVAVAEQLCREEELLHVYCSNGHKPPLGELMILLLIILCLDEL